MDNRSNNQGGFTKEEQRKGGEASKHNLKNQDSKKSDNR